MAKSVNFLTIEMKLQSSFTLIKPPWKGGWMGIFDLKLCVGKIEGLSKPRKEDFTTLKKKTTQVWSCIFLTYLCIQISSPKLTCAYGQAKQPMYIYNKVEVHYAVS